MTDKETDKEKALASAASLLGKRGGHARAAALTPERRREIAIMGGKASKGDIEQKREAGKRGGRACAESMTAEQRRNRALRAVQARQAREATMTPEQRKELKERRRERASLALQAREEKRKAATIKSGEEP